MSITTKSLSYALRSLYPGAFASYRGVVFRVTGPMQTALIGITPDLTQTFAVAQKLGSPSGKKLLAKAVNKMQEQILEESGRELPNWDNIIVTIPKKIDLRFDETLDMVYCSNPNCGTLDKLSYFKYPPKDRMPTCRRCHKAPVRQAPIWIPQKREFKTSHVLLGDPGVGIVRNMGIRQIFCYFSRPGNKCTHPQSADKKCLADFVSKLGSLIMVNPQRPIDSLRRHNPNCPKGLSVPPIKLERLWRTGSYWYKMDFPRESMTVPLQVSAVEKYELDDDTEITEVNEVLEDIKPVLFNSEMVDLEKSKFSRLRVLEITYGFRIGNKFSGISSYYLNGQENNVLGRLTDTQGFVLTLTPKFHDKIEQLHKTHEFGDEDLIYQKEVALHSLTHSLLVLAPMYTGFEPGKFHGSHDLSDEEGTSKVYVYDTDEGGNGGFSSLMNNRDNLIGMFKAIKRRLKCPTRECSNACKQCLFIKNCGNVNRKLNRHLLMATNIFWSD